MEQWKFEFVVDGLSEAAADALLQRIVSMVGVRNGKIAGGFIPVAEVDDVQEDAE